MKKKNKESSQLSNFPDLHLDAPAEKQDVAPPLESPQVSVHAPEDPVQEASGIATDSDQAELGQTDSSQAEDKKKTKPKKKFGWAGKLLRLFFFLSLIGMIVGCGVAYSLYLWASNDLPSFSRIADYRPPLVTQVLARDGSLIGQIYKEKRFLIGNDEMSKYLPMAFLAIEDDAFYSHPGVDLRAIFRAFLTNLQARETVQGGSTITQQIVKRLMLTPEKSYERKIKEAILAYQLESRLTKDEILNIYLNQIFLGHNAYGVEAASRTFFGKHAIELTLAESAMLAGLPQAPSSYDPYRNPTAAKQRQRLVLRRMRDLGWINDSEYDVALNQQLELKNMPEGMGRVAGWYLEEVRRQLLELFSEQNSAHYGFGLGMYGEDAVYTAGLTVHTSMDPVQQLAGDSALRLGLENATKRHGWLGPIAELQPSEYADFFNKNPFSLDQLERDSWVKALVWNVSPAGAEVRLGTDYKGFIDVKTMGWARSPNIKVAGSVNSTGVKDATKVLKAGDLVWASLAPPAAAPKGKPAPQAFHLADANSETLIPLSLQQYPEVQGALVSIEPDTTDVVAMIGGYSFGYEGSQFNRVTQAYRQPGSAFKPIVYSSALDNGFTASSMILDAPLLVINEDTKVAWRPRNFDGKFDGPMTLRRALARSRNLCTVRIVQQVGIETVIERAKALGLTADFPPALAVSLGAIAVSPVNLAQSYTAFANQGLTSTPRYIQRIEGPWGNEIWNNPPQHIPAITPENAFVMSDLLSDVVNMGTASRAKVLDRPLAGKTGTTNEENEAWFIGMTPHLVTAIYLGYDQPRPMGRGETGSNAALPVYINYAEKALEAYAPDPFLAPPGIIYANGDPYIPGTQPGTGYGRNAMDTVAPEAAQGEDLLRMMF